MPKKIIDEAFSYWDGLRAGRKMPLRADFDPCDIPKLLPSLMFFEVLDRGRDFRFRVIGETLRAAFFGNYTGGTLGTLPHVEADGPLMSNFRQAVETGEPVCTAVEYIGPNDTVAKHGDVILPLGNKDGTVTHLLVVVAFADRLRNLPFRSSNLL